ncbi:MAG: hypothetical protein JOS17DRAFT_525925 [Linnemannia elongata]|nr:MAG: hypothetical protein JOS17DRAFT_525925 [Linnemannia elongata]
MLAYFLLSFLEPSAHTYTPVFVQARVCVLSSRRVSHSFAILFRRRSVLCPVLPMLNSQCKAKNIILRLSSPSYLFPHPLFRGSVWQRKEDMEREHWVPAAQKKTHRKNVGECECELRKCSNVWGGPCVETQNWFGAVCFPHSLTRSFLLLGQQGTCNKTTNRKQTRAILHP